MLTIFVGGLMYELVAHWRNSLLAAMSTHAKFHAVGTGLLFWLNAHGPAASFAAAKSPPS